MPSRRQSEKAFDCRAKEGSQRKRKEGLSCLFRARMLTNRAVHKNRSGAMACRFVVSAWEVGPPRQVIWAG